VSGWDGGRFDVVAGEFSALWLLQLSSCLDSKARGRILEKLTIFNLYGV
jgi:hypothetical protein